MRKIIRLKEGEYKILKAEKWIKDPKPSTGKFVKPLPRKKAFEGRWARSSVVRTPA